MLILLEKDSNKQKLVKKFYYSLLMGATTMKQRAQLLEEQQRWKTDENKLDCYKTIGKFDAAMVTPVWKISNKESLEYAKTLIEKYGIGLGKYILANFKTDPEFMGIVMKWLRLTAQIVPACVRIIKKEGKSEFGIVDTLLKMMCEENNTELINFFSGLRINLISIMNQLMEKLKANKMLEKNSFKLPKKALTCISQLISLLIYLDNIPESGPIKVLKPSKSLFKNPTIRCNIQKYTFYHEKMMDIAQGLCQNYDELHEISHSEIIISIKNACDLLESANGIVS